MALVFTNTAGALFNRLGRIGKLADIAKVAQADIRTAFNAFLAQYDSSVAAPLQIVTNGTPARRDVAVASASAFVPGLAQEALNTLREMVLADVPPASASPYLAWTEVRKQMLEQGKTIKACVVTCVATAVGGNAGDGAMVVSTKRGDGLVNQLSFDEASSIQCVADAQYGRAIAGSEVFAYSADPRDRSVWSVDYPSGSGANPRLVAVSATKDATASSTSGNMLVNSNFELFTANLPNKWDAVVGTAGTDFVEDVADMYSGTKCLKIVGGTTNTNISQVFNLDNKNPANLRPSQSYAVNFYAKMSATPATGVLKIELTDQNGAVCSDDQGVANAISVDLTTLGTSYVKFNGVFRTPKDIPSSYRISIRVDTDIDADKFLFLDHMAMTPLITSYPGGPGVALFSGNTDFIVDDRFTVVTTNDFGGSTRQQTFHWLLEKLFGMRMVGVLLPSSATPNISDTLITS